ncbi:GATA-binding factor 2 [Sarracenia purpurea var. burkii]
MDAYGVPAPECFRIDDLLDFSNDELFSTANTDSGLHLLPPSGNTYSSANGNCNAPNPNQCADFTDDLCVPSDDVAELEWLSNFVDDSFTDFSADEFAGFGNQRPMTSFHGRPRSKRSKAASTNNGRGTPPESKALMIGKSKENLTSNTGKKRESTSSSSVHTGDRSLQSSSETSQAVVRRCTHCASEKTPQWRTGPLGPKTLCNACGVRYKSGRLVPEYRPAASPTFVLTQHSNSHRKVMELRRQKETLRQQPQPEQHQRFHHHHHNFEVC